LAAEVRERLAVSKQKAHRIHTDMRNLNKLNEATKKEYHRDEI
jgi:hypothetical protein